MNQPEGRVRLRYLRLVPGTAGRVQSCLRYRQYGTAISSVFDDEEFFIVRLKMAARKQETSKLANVFFLVIEDSIEEEIKSNVNTNFGSVKYFENVNKMDNSTDCLLN